jgi:chemotaxis signal transduction protein
MPMVAKLNRGLKMVRCGLGDETYSVDLGQVRSLERTDRVNWEETGTPLVGHWVHRQESVPIFDLGLMLDRPTRVDAGSGHLVIFNSEPEPWGLLVDRVSQVATFGFQKVLPLPDLLHEMVYCFHGAIDTMYGLSLILDARRLNPEVNLVQSVLESGIAPLDDDDILIPSFGKKSQLFTFGLPGIEEGSRPIRFGLPGLQVVEVLETASPIPVPGTPPQLLGITLWRNRLLPVFDPAILLGLPVESSDRTRMVVLRVGAEYAAIRTSTHMRLQSLPLPHLPSQREFPIEHESIQQVIELRDERVALVDIRSWFRGD